MGDLLETLIGGMVFIALIIACGISLWLLWVLGHVLAPGWVGDVLGALFVSMGMVFIGEEVI